MDLIDFKVLLPTSSGTSACPCSTGLISKKRSTSLSLTSAGWKSSWLTKISSCCRFFSVEDAC